MCLEVLVRAGKFGEYPGLFFFPSSMSPFPSLMTVMTNIIFRDQLFLDREVLLSGLRWASSQRCVGVVVG